MRHIELSRVQHGTTAVALTIKPISYQRVPDRGQVDTNLVRPPRFEYDRGEGTVGGGGEWSDVCDRTLAAVADGEGDRSDAQQRRVNRLRLAELTFAECQVCFADPLFLEL